MTFSRLRITLMEIRAAICVSVALASMVLVALPAEGSGHREANGILGMPQVDATDFYMFRSYESGRQGYVTLIANYGPLQDPWGGPLYFPLDTTAAYDIHVLNDGGTVENLTFRFRFIVTSPLIPLPVGPTPVFVPIGVVNAGPFGPGVGNFFLNEHRAYTIEVIRGPVGAPDRTDDVINPRTGGKRFGMPFDYIGENSVPNYETYAANRIYDVTIPGCGGTARVFAGPRREPFAANVGKISDLVNIDVLGAPDAESSPTAEKNVTSIALEVPIGCLVGRGDGVIGAWTTARLPRIRILTENPTFAQPFLYRGDLVQVSRMGNPLVNLELIGVPHKNLFNASHPSRDSQFEFYFTHPTLPEALELLHGRTAPDVFPRTDFSRVYLNGIAGLNATSEGDMLRLDTAVEPAPRDQQDRLGFLGGDRAGFPNGRRPGDDVWDITLRLAMGARLDSADAPDGQLPFTDNVIQEATTFDDRFPYLLTPIPGSRRGAP